MLKIRLRRVGKTKKPYYRVVVAQNEKKRDGAFLETLGSYDPHADPPSVQVDGDKAREWISRGAQPSEAAEKVLRRAGVIAGAAGAAAPATASKPATATEQARAAAESDDTDATPWRLTFEPNTSAEPVVAPGGAAAATPPAAAEAAEEAAGPDAE